MKRKCYAKEMGKKGRVTNLLKTFIVGKWRKGDDRIIPN